MRLSSKKIERRYRASQTVSNAVIHPSSAFVGIRRLPLNEILVEANFHIDRIGQDAS